MRSSVFSYLNPRILAIFLMFAGISLPPMSLAQQSPRGGALPNTDCPVINNTSSGKPDAGVPCGLQALVAATRTDSAAILNPTGNHYQNHDREMMSIVSGLVLAPGKSIQDARKAFERAARRGNTDAEVNLGILYLYGWGTPQNLGTCLYWLKSAADHGNSRASANLGLLYWNGWGVRTDYAEALRYFRKAADLGDSGAMVDLGYMIDYGVGTSQDHAAAAEWYRRGAERGDPLAQNNLADLYLRGEGVPQNDDLAFAWFQKAALQGNTGARIKLGFLYANGRATRKDAETAYAWILAAANAGDHRGQTYLDALEAQLSPDQIASAKRRAKELQPSPGAHRNDVAFVH
jgi:TPR repeat protein